MSMILRLFYRYNPGQRLIRILSSYKPAEKFLKEHLIVNRLVIAVPYASVGSAAMFASEPEGEAWIRSRFRFMSK